MKKLLALLIGVLSVWSFASAADDKPIEITQLPKAAQLFVAKHFPKAKVSYAMVDKSLFGNEYKVVFADANKVEFNKDGAWTDVECKKGSVPAGIVPGAIQTFVSQKHQGMKIVKIEKDVLGYEVTLSSGMEMKFDPKFNFVRYDD